MGNTPVELQVQKLSALGEGLATWQGRSVHVPGAFPGDTVLAQLSDTGKTLTGELQAIVREGPGRRAAPCALSGRCGGCDWLELDEARQRQARDQLARDVLQRVGGLSPDSYEVRPVLASPKALGYRRRASLRFGGGALGFFGRRSHEHVAVPTCPAMVEPLSRLLSPLSALLSGGAGDIAAVELLAEGQAWAMALELKGAVKAKHRELAGRSMSALGARGVVLVPKAGSPELLGKPVLRGEAPGARGVPLYLRPDAFSQANAEAAPLLVAAALELLAPDASDAAVELYSGNGLFSFGLAARAASVLAVEGSAASVALAQRSAREAQVANLRFIQGDVARVCDGLAREGRRFRVMLADPPRTGAPGIAGWAAGLGVERLAYVACDLGALAKDARALKAKGFIPRVLQLADMFPQTRHVEAVMCFAKEEGA